MSEEAAALPTLPLPALPPRRADSHKGDFGRCLLVGGSRGMSGAIALAGQAALRSGAGLVKLAVPDACLNVVAALEPSYMTVALPGDEEGRLTGAALPPLRTLAEAATSVACGPGLGRSPALDDLVAVLYDTLPRPAVFDADALNALAVRGIPMTAVAAPRILTPHPGEFRRLIGDAAAQLSPATLRGQAIAWAGAHHVVLVLKGQRTLITDGQRVTYNPSGNPGMATGGSGDVLTGVVAALVGQGLAPFEAAQLGVYVHGLAGDLAAAQLGEISLIASDLPRFLPPAFLRRCPRTGESP